MIGIVSTRSTSSTTRNTNSNRNSNSNSNNGNPNNTITFRSRTINGYKENGLAFKTNKLGVSSSSTLDNGNTTATPRRRALGDISNSKNNNNNNNSNNSNNSVTRSSMNKNNNSTTKPTRNAGAQLVPRVFPSSLSPFPYGKNGTVMASTDDMSSSTRPPFTDGSHIAATPKNLQTKSTKKLQFTSRLQKPGLGPRNPTQQQQPKSQRQWEQPKSPAKPESDKENRLDNASSEQHQGLKVPQEEPTKKVQSKKSVRIQLPPPATEDNDVDSLDEYLQDDGDIELPAGRLWSEQNRLEAEMEQKEQELELQLLQQQKEQAKKSYYYHCEDNTFDNDNDNLPNKTRNEKYHHLSEDIGQSVSLWDDWRDVMKYQMHAARKQREKESKTKDEEASRRQVSVDAMMEEKMAVIWNDDEQGLDELLDWVEGFDLDSGYNLNENDNEDDDWSAPASSTIGDDDDDEEEDRKDDEETSSVIVGF